MNLSSTVITLIIKEYSVRKKEFVKYTIDTNSVTYKNKTILGYHITIYPETQYGQETGRILVQHTCSDGKISYIDTWVEKENGVIFIARDTPQSMKKKPDYEYVKELQEEIEELREMCIKLKDSKERVIINQNNYTKRRVGRPKIDDLVTQQIIADCKSGMKKTEIAKKYGIERKTIYNLLKREV